MAGHSKWANIKHKKAAMDAKRGKLFTRLSKEISIAAKINGDPDGNPRLRTLIEKAREANMPSDNINRAIKKGTGELPGVTYEAITYEGYGPHGVAVIVDALTDNKNRTVADLRRIFSHNGGSLGETGSVNWMFEKMGVIEGPSDKSEDEILESLMEHDINNVEVADGEYYITCPIKSIEDIKNFLKSNGFKVDKSEIEWVAKTKTDLGEDQAKEVLEFLDEVEDFDDTQNVFSNLA